MIGSTWWLVEGVTKEKWVVQGDPSLFRGSAFCSRGVSQIGSLTNLKSSNYPKIIKSPKYYKFGKERRSWIDIIHRESRGEGKEYTRERM